MGPAPNHRSLLYLHSEIYQEGEDEDGCANPGFSGFFRESAAFFIRDVSCLRITVSARYTSRKIDIGCARELIATFSGIFAASCSDRCDLIESSLSLRGSSRDKKWLVRRPRKKNRRMLDFLHMIAARGAQPDKNTGHSNEFRFVSIRCPPRISRVWTTIVKPRSSRSRERVAARPAPRSSYPSREAVATVGLSTARCAIDGLLGMCLSASDEWILSHIIALSHETMLMCKLTTRRLR